MPPGRRLLRTRSRAGIINNQSCRGVLKSTWLCEERCRRGRTHTLTAFAGVSDAKSRATRLDSS